jgi:hypothetical protein
MTATPTPASLRLSARWLARLAAAAVLVGFIATCVLVASASGLLEQARDAAAQDGGGALRREVALGDPQSWAETGRSARAALSVMSWSVAIALLAGVGAILTAHRAGASPKALRVLLPLLLLGGMASAARADRDADLAAAAAAVQTRSDIMIDTHVTRPFPAPAPDPGSPALGNASYALAALWENVDVAAANQMLVDIRDGAFPDEYWAMGQIVRAYMLFNCDSSFRPGRLTSEAEEALEDVLRRHLDLYSRLDEANEPTSWIIDGSENHDIMRRSVSLLGARILARDPARASVALPDGRLPAEHHAAWSAYFLRYLQERARKGLFVERASPTYAKYTLRCV